MVGSVNLTQKKLLQDKLNVTNKTRSNPFNWRGQFTPEFVDYMLESFAGEDYTIIDPFSGSGTVLLECSRKKLNCYGFEVNPSAYIMSRFFSYANLPFNARVQIFSDLEKKITDLTTDFSDLPLFEEKKFYRESYSNLLEFARTLFSIITDIQERILALNILFISEKGKSNDVAHNVISASNYIRHVLFSLPYTDRAIKAHLGDARSIHVVYPGEADMILTSPPYINVFNYHQNYRAIVELLGWDILRVARSEIGSNRKNRSNRFRTVIQYCLDMEQALISFWNCLRENGLISLVIGRESNVRRVPFYNGEIVKDIAEQLGCYEGITNYERTFLNKFGNNIKEDIIVMRKGATPPLSSQARNVAVAQLKRSMDIAPHEVRKDISEAIHDVNNIHPSPLLPNEGAKIDE